MRKYFSLIACFLSLHSMANEAISPYIIQTGKNLNPLVLLADKNTFQFTVWNLETGKSLYQSIMATGKIIGNKTKEGDKKTPEGIYLLTSTLSRADLDEMYGKKVTIYYGKGALVTNYPNPVDLLQNKTGSGIWIHSRDDESRLNRKYDSNGCVLIKNNGITFLQNNFKAHELPLIITSHDKKNNKFIKASLEKIYSLQKKWQEVDLNLRYYKLQETRIIQFQNSILIQASNDIFYINHYLAFVNEDWKIISSQFIPREENP